MGAIAITTVLFACKGNSTNANGETRLAETMVLSAADSVKMEEFEKWKEQNDQVAEKQKTVVVYRELRKPAAVSNEEQAVSSSAGNEETNATAGTPTETGGTTAGSSDETNEPVTPTSETEQKKGWSKAAKGAVIGGVTGAAAGAIINKKNRGVGAVIGGVVGAGVGYGIGRSKDKKDGRY